jgi:hypothetical protein
MCPSRARLSPTDRRPVALRLLFGTINEDNAHVFLRVNIRQFLPAIASTTSADRTVHMAYPRGEGSSELDLDFCCADGSPYWPPEEKDAPAHRFIGNESYEESLSHYSASHLPRMNRSFQGTPAPVHDADDGQLRKAGHDERRQKHLNGHVSGKSEIVTTQSSLPNHISPETRPGSPSGSDQRFRMPNIAHMAEHPLSDDVRVASPASKIHHPSPSGGVWLDVPGITAIGDAAHLLYGSRDLLPTIESAWEKLRSNKPMLGRVHRELTGGDLCEVFVDVSAHRHHGHTSAMKVRPAVGVNHSVWRPKACHSIISKVGPLCELPPFQYPKREWEPLGLPSRWADSPSDSGIVETNPLAEDISLYPSIDTSEEPTPVPSIHFEAPPGFPRGVGGSSLLVRESSVSPGTSFMRSSGQAAVSELPAKENAALTKDSMLTEGATAWGNMDHILYPRPHAKPEGLVPFEHLGHSAVSKVQPCNDGATTPDPLSTFVSPQLELCGERSESLQKLEKKRSATHLVAYWESVNKGFNQAAPLSGDKHACCARETNAPLEAANARNQGFQWSPTINTPGTANKPNLTELPRGKSSQPKPDSTAAGRPTENTPATAPVDDKFKEAVINLEHLLNEAMVLAKEIADHEDQQCVDTLRLTEVNRAGALHSPPSVHESLPSEIESSSEERRIETTPPVTRGPKHSRSTLGMHSRNVVIGIPNRTSSLLKSKFASGTWLGRSRDCSREQRDSNIRPGHRPNERSVVTLREESGSNSDGDSPKRSGCLGSGKIARKIRSCRLPRLQTRSSFQHGIVDGPAPVDDDQPPTDAPAPVRLKPANWNYDGASDEDVWVTGSDILKGSGDGHVSSEWGSQRPHSAPPVSHEAVSEPERESRLKNHGSIRISLRGRSHVSVRGYQGVNLARAYRRQPIARDWSAVRKRFVATVTCLSTAAIGVLIGIYAGMVPSIQYWIADLEHFAILGNVFFYIGLAIPTFFFWPLPLLHGRKPYILSSLVLAMPLLFPQAISVSEMRSPYVSTWR